MDDWVLRAGMHFGMKFADVLRERQEYCEEVGESKKDTEQMDSEVKTNATGEFR